MVEEMKELILEEEPKEEMKEDEQFQDINEEQEDTKDTKRNAEIANFKAKANYLVKKRYNINSIKLAEEDIHIYVFFRKFY